MSDHERCDYCWRPVGELRFARGGHLFCCQDHALRGYRKKHLHVLPPLPEQLTLEDDGPEAA